MRSKSKDQPLQVGFGREVSATQRRVVLHDLPWRAIAGGYAASVSVQSTGAHSLRVGMRLNKSVTSLEFVLKGSTVPASALVRDAAADPYWSPVVDGDTLRIELKAAAVPPADIVLELPIVSHIA